VRVLVRGNCDMANLATCSPPIEMTCQNQLRVLCAICREMAGKLKGLTRPGSKIVLSEPSQPGAPASTGSAETGDDAAVGQALVGRPVRKLFKGNGWFDGTVTHYVPSSDVYRVR
jgi:hypothetical protein